MNETDVAFSVSSYLVILTLLLGTSGLAGETINFPNPEQFDAEASQTTTNSGGLDCAIKIGTSVAFGFIGNIAADALGFDCASVVKSVPVLEDLAKLAAFAFAFAKFFFQFMTFQLAIPTLLNSILIVPAVLGLGYVGVRLVRGGA